MRIILAVIFLGMACGLNASIPESSIPSFCAEHQRAERRFNQVLEKLREAKKKELDTLDQIYHTEEQLTRPRSCCRPPLKVDTSRLQQLNDTISKKAQEHDAGIVAKMNERDAWLSGFEAFFYVQKNKKPGEPVELNYHEHLLQKAQQMKSGMQTQLQGKQSKGSNSSSSQEQK